MSISVTELDVDELRALIEDVVRRVLKETLSSQPELAEPRSPLDIPMLDVGPWPEGLELISREEMYGDDGR